MKEQSDENLRKMEPGKLRRESGKAAEKARVADITHWVTLMKN